MTSNTANGADRAAGSILHYWACPHCAGLNRGSIVKVCGVCGRAKVSANGGAPMTTTTRDESWFTDTVTN